MSRSDKDREAYRQKGLYRRDLAANPFEQFRRWFAEAQVAELPEPNAMTLSTASRDGRPSGRMVLLKEVDERGFVFYTNYESRKGHELAKNPWAALTFWWPHMARQVRVEGRVEKVSPAESDAYFRTRPRGSQIGAWASPQSAVLSSRAELEARYRDFEARFAKRDVPRPPHWGGYRLIPDAFEFWQGRLNRLHDRFRYRRGSGGTWVIERLAP
ncbi:MAG: pyridoxamine 5'-phosphate oxidase [Ardenticatenia bacterium]|nr:pyridoxamine 5'-phosphate oxidase [Ardenticatenia bacterium]